MFNAATPRPQLSSCFLLMMPDDSIDGIYKCLTQCAFISKSAGGIGVNVHNIRAKGKSVCLSFKLTINGVFYRHLHSGY